MSERAKKILDNYRAAEGRRDAELVVFNEVVASIRDGIEALGRELKGYSDHSVGIDGPRIWRADGGRAVDVGRLQIKSEFGGPIQVVLVIGTRHILVFQADPGQFAGGSQAALEGFNERLEAAVRMVLTTYWIKDDRAPSHLD